MKKIVAILACSVAVVGIHAQTIVFDNSTTPLAYLWGQVLPGAASGPEGGDEIDLVGTDREVVNIDILIHVLGTTIGFADTQVRFYANDGAGAPADPGSLLWDSGPFAALPHAIGLQTMSFAVPNITVPNTFTWTIEFTNRTGSTGAMGTRGYDPPTDGTSRDDFWIHNPDTTWLRSFFGGPPDVANFGATVTAVPEPASMLILGAGLMALAARRRRRKA